MGLQSPAEVVLSQYQVGVDPVKRPVEGASLRRLLVVGLQSLAEMDLLRYLEEVVLSQHPAEGVLSHLVGPALVWRLPEHLAVILGERLEVAFLQHWQVVVLQLHSSGLPLGQSTSLKWGRQDVEFQGFQLS